MPAPPTPPVRPVLPADAYAPDVAAELADAYKDTLDEIQAALKEHDVVIIGMANNSHCTDAKKWLKKAGVASHYMEIGGYHNKWKRRLAIKMWSGWPTFPQVFIKGMLIGGSGGVADGLKDGSILKRLGR